MSNNIDKYFRSKLQSGNFKPDPAGWAGAEELLGKGARGAWLGGKWLSIALLAITTTLAISYAVISDEDQAISKESFDSSIEMPLAKEANHPVKKENNPATVKQAERKQGKSMKGSDEVAKIENEPANTPSQPVIANENEYLTTQKGKTTTKERNLGATALAPVTQANGETPSATLENTDNKEFEAAQTNKNATTIGSSQTIMSGEEEQVSTHNSNKTEKGTEATKSINTAATQKPEASSTMASAATGESGSEIPNSNKNDEQYTGETKSELNSTGNDLDPSSSENENTEEKEDEIDPNLKPYHWTDNLTLAAGAEVGFFPSNRILEGEAQYTNFRNKYELVKGTRTLGISGQLGYKNWTFTTGVFQSQIQEELNYPDKIEVEKITDNSYWSYAQYWSYNVDSTWIIDSIYHGRWGYDTSWTFNEDSSYISQIDTSLSLEESDALARSNGVKTITYTEVPVLLGRSFKAKRFVFDVQAGIAFGFLTRVEGGGYATTSLDGVYAPHNELTQYNKVLYTGVLRLGVRAAINKNWEVGLYPGIRYTLNSVLTQGNVNQRYFGYGVQLGVQYQF